MKTKQSPVDLIGIGIGPFNLGLAALVDGLEEQTSLFFDDKPEFNWHPGMMINGTTLQVPFLADLVTMVDPRSPYSFLEYLREHGRLFSFYFYERFQIPRREYNHYCQWVAEQLPQCQFGKRVIQIEEEEDLWKVVVEDNESGVFETYQAKNIVLGVGTTPVIPKIDGLSSEEEYIFHSAEFRKKEEIWKGSKRVTVVGSGQSAGEVFYEVLHNKSEEQQLNWLTRSRGFFPMEYSKLGLEHFSPDYTAYFYDLPQETKDALLPKQDLLYKGISADTIASIYDLLYERTIGGKTERVHLQPLTELVGGEKGGRDGRYTLYFNQWEKENYFSLETDVLIMATGYQQTIPSFLQGVEHLIKWDQQGRYDVGHHYEIKMKEKRQHRMFVQNGELHTHGPGAPDLGLGAHRNAHIINEITGREIYRLQDKNVFQCFG
ncbi:lysine N(6)-hydroxylase/L-ornithine N(5)-oxygenase family protein [Bacillus sp. FJAT-44742]|uniref:lysine N(6)-hydroxylase/L-ornithine N(5)-oxygenase family protein n=1 Tax=Bacillus sp. FJAT-44742 TaxID=2014005 RepID=UPI000C2309C3|nr:lysine N(6)-hydroxylase/L-ornithine N(5)-oxygenase family protein [Bacillus sp. FJAT-44742]